jgi:hypothetical protein
MPDPESSTTLPDTIRARNDFVLWPTPSTVFSMLQGHSEEASISIGTRSGDLSLGASITSGSISSDAKINILAAPSGALRLRSTSKPTLMAALRF